MRKITVLSLITVALRSVDDMAASAAPSDPVPIFEQWAAAQGTPVENAACDVDEVTTCYGLLAADPASPDWSAVLVGVAADETLTFTQVQSFPAAPSPPSPPSGAALMEPVQVDG